MQCVAVSAPKRFRQCVAVSEEIPADNIFLSRIAQVAMLCLSAANPRIAFGKLQRRHFAFCFLGLPGPCCLSLKLQPIQEILFASRVIRVMLC